MSASIIFTVGMQMVSNLNQISFQAYGSVLHDKNQTQIPQPGQVREVMSGKARVLISDKPVRLRASEGMTVLGVSLDGKDYVPFYLDRTVMIKPGVRFTLTAFKGTSSVELWAEDLRALESITPGTELRLLRQLHINCIYTMFYHEREKGFIFPGGTHQAVELIYVDKGSVHSVADGMDILLEQGEMTFHAPNQWHMLYADDDVPASYLSITFDLEGLSPAVLFNKKFPLPQSAVRVLHRIMQEYERMDEYSGDLLISLLQALLLMILREQGSPNTDKLRTTNSINNENEIIRRAQQYISVHVRDKLSVPLVARHVDVSPSYLTALFRKNLQISPGEYIRRIKLQESKQMIREDKLNFTQIASALQYSTVHHFSRQFKEKFGITPTEYAKSVR